MKKMQIAFPFLLSVALFLPGVPSLWSRTNCVETAHLKLSGKPTEIAYSPDGTLIAIGYNAGQIEVWETKSKSRMLVINADAEAGVWALQFTSDSKRLISIRGTKQFALYAIPEGKQILAVEGIGFSGCLGKDERTLAAQASDQTICLWNLETGEIIRKFSKKGIGRTQSMSFTQDYKYLVTVIDWNSSLILNAETGEPVPFNMAAPVRLTSEPLGGNQVAIGQGDLNDDGAPVRRILAGPSGQVVAVVRGWAGKPDFVELWDIEKKARLARFKPKDGGNLDLPAFSSDNRLLAITGDRGTSIWDISGKKQVGSIKQGGMVTFSPIANELALANESELIIFSIQ